ncbi:TIGR00730 family Rossman fold protein [Candidatus Protochlamydia phocaeensis]|uniref:LOG family protein n=1 Tax=Candidatus Protochlamydia phocaeensis TaxID=1414722 RepID=UPI000838599B|nr:TIGR00730 family Rossman fold protein [Candidatus Protochlamydia phocaeensis]
MTTYHEEEKQVFTHDSWRVFRIISEFVDGFETMTNLGPSVSIFGSARLPPDSLYYNLAVDVARHISKKGFAIITGGGPGIMEAANKGAQEANGHSCGLAIDLPFESEPNRFIDPKYRLNFRYFFIRKVMFIRYAQGYVFLPGGFGTLDELFEALTLIQTKKIKAFPIYLMGKAYWTEMLKWIEETMLSHGCISPDDFNMFQITDDPEEVANGIERHYQRDRAFRNF